VTDVVISNSELTFKYTLTSTTALDHKSYGYLYMEVTLVEADLSGLSDC